MQEKLKVIPLQISKHVPGVKSKLHKILNHRNLLTRYTQLHTYLPVEFIDLEI